VTHRGTEAARLRLGRQLPGLAKHVTKKHTSTAFHLGVCRVTEELVQRHCCIATAAYTTDLLCLHFSRSMVPVDVDVTNSRHTQLQLSSFRVGRAFPSGASRAPSVAGHALARAGLRFLERVQVAPHAR
jgi:hypothetical protein